MSTKSLRDSPTAYFECGLEYMFSSFRIVLGMTVNQGSKTFLNQEVYNDEGKGLKGVYTRQSGL